MIIASYFFIGLAALTLLFFGSVFGTWTGLVVAGVGTLVGAIISANILYLNFSGTLLPINRYFMGYTYIWPEHLGLALIGFISGYAAFKQKGRYNIGRSLGFSARGIIAGTFFAAICNIIFLYSGSYYASQIRTLFLIFAAIYLGIDLIFLPILLLIYHKNIVRRKSI